MFALACWWLWLTPRDGAFELTVTLLLANHRHRGSQAQVLVSISKQPDNAESATPQLCTEPERHRLLADDFVRQLLLSNSHTTPPHTLP
jgi:hypothetical protein